MLIDQYRKIKKRINRLRTGELVPVGDIWDLYQDPKDYPSSYDLHVDIGHQIIIFENVFLRDVTTSCPVAGDITEEYGFEGESIPKGVTLNRADYNDSWWLYRK